MLGLPSTTEVDRRLPKEAFYRHLRLDARTRRSFVDDIDSIVVTNSIKPATSGFADGRDVHEILVLAILLKSDRQPTGVIETIASANPHRIVFHTEPGGTTCVMRRGLQSSRDIRGLALSGETLDDVWDSICSQVAFGDVDGRDVDGRLDVARRIASLEAEISDLDAKCRKVRQINRKNELFAELRTRQAELRDLRTGIAKR